MATNDAHYLRKEDADAGRAALHPDRQDRGGRGPYASSRPTEFYVKSDGGDARLFAMVPDACANTQIIADLCIWISSSGTPTSAVLQGPTGMDNQEFFEKLCGRAGARYRPAPQEQRQLDYEMASSRRWAYADYFLIVWDFVNYAKSQGIPWARAVAPARAASWPTAWASRHRPHEV